MAEKKYTSIGGQAVLEGVMMRSPHYMTIAVRKPDGGIVIKEMEWRGFGDRFPILKKPFLRGITTLVESMVNGIEALSYSANIAVANEATPEGNADEKKELSNFEIFSSIFIAFAMGMGLFVAAPHLLTLAVGKLGVFEHGTANPLFHLIDGVIKVIFLVAYILGISMMKDIKRVFQYHGAEHKSIYAFESGEELTVENARKHTTMHPRCGTSFLLFLLVISILVFSGLFPLFGMLALPEHPVARQFLLIVIKIGLMFPVAGISYEFIRLSANHMDNPIFRAMIYPGLLMQKLTTREPDDSQLEIALASLRRVLVLEKAPQELKAQDFEVKNLSEIVPVRAAVSDFLG